MSNTNTTRQIKLLGYIKISGTIKAITGLHIGGTADSIDKGGIDNPVIKNPVTNEPYIPGSSLRGKMRSLLEKKTTKVFSPMTNEIWMEMYDDKNYNQNKAQSTIDAMSSEVCRVFGNSASYESVPSVLVVRDALYTDTTRKSFMENNLPKTEAKMEIAVDRITAHALPRTIERVPAGAEFGFEIIYKIQEMTFATDEKKTSYQIFKPSQSSIKKDIENILWALEQIQEHEGLGGNTSRGHGQVKFALNPLKSETFGAIKEIQESEDEINKKPDEEKINTPSDSKEQGKSTTIDIVIKQIQIPSSLKKDEGKDKKAA
ncbi:MAG: type III-A CRISPR-associated RAMP protein Csm3 [Chloroherpetonaceae bacterium]|nr:type III-A CRISPR-associated RAMP protein Csm3 [Chloroherpetonaceae bacterium]